MIIRDIRLDTSSAGATLAGTIALERPNPEAFRLTYTVRGGRPEWLSTGGEAFVAVALIAAMARGEDVAVEAPLSPQFLRRLTTVMDIYRAWQPGLRSIRIVAPLKVPDPHGGGTGLFFSAGVDSFYSLLKNAEPSATDADQPVSHLLLVFGFDVPLDNPGLFTRIASRVQPVADAVAKPLIVVETNVRAFTDRVLTWELYHGAAMAGVGLALGGLLRRCTIASTYAYDELHPWGSHPLLDPLWSTEALEFVHDGCEARRGQKIRRLAGSPMALSALHVCWQNGDRHYNCGRCEKCLRTMLALHVAGVLAQCRTFDQPLTAAAVRGIHVDNLGVGLFLEEALSALGASPEDQRLKRAIEYALRGGSLRRRLGLLARLWLRPRAAAAALRAPLGPHDFGPIARGA